MQSDNKHTDRKLQELENLSLPDLSKMDEHWQQMKTILQPGIVPLRSKQVPVKKVFWWMVAAAVSGCIGLLTYDLIVTQKTKKTLPHQTVQPVTFDSKSDKGLMPVASDTGEHFILSQPNRGPRPQVKLRVINKPDTITMPAVMTQAEPPVPDESARLNDFFKQLEKPSQEFVINNKKDTLITGREGSSLLIPAHTFGMQDKVVITLKEFFSYKDIITHKLSTIADDEQLETAGMIHISASVNGKEVNMSPGKKIRWFLEDTTSSMEGMQLFTGSAPANYSTQIEKKNSDTLSFVINNSINWQPQPQRFQSNYINVSVKVLDLRDLPYKVTTTRGKYRGFFAINKESELSKEELIDALQKKYPYYDKVIIRKRSKNKTWVSFIESSSANVISELTTHTSIGDSTWLPAWEAKIYKLPSRDTIISSNTNSIQNTSIPNIELRRLASRYSVDILSLGWINCDRFYNDNRSKVEYVVNLNDKASNYYTVLVFDRIKSMMPGYAAGNKVIFSRVPKGEMVKILSIGIQDGKTVSAIAPVEISKSTFTGLKFEEITPRGFKEQAASMDK